VKNTDGTVDRYPTSGGADRFLDFIQTELIPEIDRRYRTEACRIFTGHSLGGLIAIYILVNCPEMFQAYIASSPSLWWDDQHTLRQAAGLFCGSRGTEERTLLLARA
jgi:predicted alpha/beta superfamily hydrolase